MAMFFAALADRSREFGRVLIEMNPAGIAMLAATC